MSSSMEQSVLLEEDNENLSTEGFVSSSPSVPLLTRFLYSIGPLGVDTSHLIIGFFFTPFLLEVAKLDPYLAGFVFLCGQIVDGVTTPLIGKLTDNIRTRWGRRRVNLDPTTSYLPLKPWLIFGGVPFTILYICLWHTWVQSLGQISSFVYYMLIYACFSLSGNCITVPLFALTPDLTETYDHSIQLTEAKTVVFGVVSIVCVMAHSYLIEAFPMPGNSTHPDAEKGYSVSAITLGIFFGAGAIICGVFLKEKRHARTEPEEKVEKGIIDSIKDLFFTLKSRSFLCILISYILGWTGVQLLQNNLFLYTKYVVDKEDQFMFFVLGVLGTTAPAAFFWSKVAGWAGKRNVMVYNALQFCLILLSLFFVNSTTPVWVMYCIAIGAGISIGQILVIPWSMIPDIIDEDERDRGVRREGAFYSIFILIQKIGLAAALSMTSWILGAVGYIAPDDTGSEAETQPPEVVYTLRVIAGPFAASAVFCSAIPLLFYRLDRQKVEEITEELQGRNVITQLTDDGRETYKDPFA